VASTAVLYLDAAWCQVPPNKLKVHFSQQSRTPLDSDFHSRMHRDRARATGKVAQHGGCTGRNEMYLREKRALFTLTLKPFIFLVGI